MVRLYRGFGEVILPGIVENIFIQAPRKPKDTHIDMHQISDEWFKMKFGINARSTTIICSTDIEQAFQYASGGMLAEIKPIEPYSVIYSENVVDFLEHCIEMKSPFCRENIEDWLDQKEYICTNSVSNIPEYFRGEVMLYCERYMLSNVGDALKFN